MPVPWLTMVSAPVGTVPVIVIVLPDVLTVFPPAPVKVTDPPELERVITLVRTLMVCSSFEDDRSPVLDMVNVSPLRLIPTPVPAAAVHDPPELERVDVKEVVPLLVRLCNSLVADKSPELAMTYGLPDVPAPVTPMPVPPVTIVSAPVAGVPVMVIVLPEVVTVLPPAPAMVADPPDALSVIALALTERVCNSFVLDRSPKLLMTVPITPIPVPPV